MRILIGQCLCGPARHAILALAMKPDIEEDAIQLLKASAELALIGQGGLLGLPKMNPWCGLCGAWSDRWIYEIGWSREFTDWETALAELRKLETHQRATAALMDMLDLSYDAHKRTRH